VKIALHCYRETIIARIKSHRKIARGLYAELINAILEGETATACATPFAHINSF
jgi:hypothetical protein